MTRIQSEVNVPFVRFKEYLGDLERKRLVQLEPVLRLTERGLRYVQEYRRVLQFLETFGLTDRESARQEFRVTRPAADPPIDPPPEKRSEKTSGASSGDKS